MIKLATLPLPAPVCSKLGKDNPGLEWNLISVLKALKELTVLFVYNMMIGCSETNRENDSKKAFEKIILKNAD